MHKLQLISFHHFPQNNVFEFWPHKEITYNNVMSLGLIVVKSMGFMSEFEDGEQDPNFILPLT